jgi:hypothetical protein
MSYFEMNVISRGFYIGVYGEGPENISSIMGKKLY